LSEKGGGVRITGGGKGTATANNLKVYKIKRTANNGKEKGRRTKEPLFKKGKKRRKTPLGEKKGNLP